ncbi:hypothetical protein [Virgibacillus kimchii]
MKKVHSEEQGVKIISPSDCGNAPKKKVLRDFLVAFAVKDISFINEYTRVDIYWEIVNDMVIQGREEMVKLLDKRMVSPTLELEIHTVITHGKTASANGTLKLENNRVYAFSNVFNFVSAGKNTIKDITSYVIRMD